MINKIIKYTKEHPEAIPQVHMVDLLHCKYRVEFYSPVIPNLVLKTFYSTISDSELQYLAKELKWKL